LVRELHARWGAGNQPARARRAEDSAAAQVLGASIRFTALPDCIYRVDERGVPLYPTGADLFEAVRWAQDLAAQPAALLEAIGDLLPDLERVYLPLAVGNHVDHQVARGWAAHLPCEVWYYTDYPYARDGALVERALSGGQVWRRTEIVLSPEDVRAKIDSICRYESQLSTFWPDWAAMAAQLNGFLTRDGAQPPAEQYWIRGDLGR
jgi:LmbE family N-acetylglucosaminyl deacetylase